MLMVQMSSSRSKNACTKHREVLWDSVNMDLQLFFLALICKVKFTHMFDFLLALKARTRQNMKSGGYVDGD